MYFTLIPNGEEVTAAPISKELLLERLEDDFYRDVDLFIQVTGGLIYRISGPISAEDLTDENELRCLKNVV